ncbi:MAG: helix-turn-helix domain-containing protein [Candidatus Acidiferrum sp.]
MPKRPALFRPQQKRSRESLCRMLDAAETVLNRHGLEGATVSRIAAKASLSPASVYRRFPDKDALMRAVFSRGTEVNQEELAREVDLKQVGKIGIRIFAQQWVAGMLSAYRARTGLMRATVLYAQQHERTPFVSRQRDLEIQNFKKLVKTFLIWRDEIRHPDPEYAVSYGILTVAFALRELILFDQARMFEHVLPVRDDNLKEELPRMFLRYLGIETE